MARAVRIVALGNAAAGAEKQALALGARLRDQLQHRQPRVTSMTAVAAQTSIVDLSCVRVPLRSDSIAHKLPPLLHVAAAVLANDPFFGYDLSDAHKQELCSSDVRDQKSSSRSHPLRVVIGCGRTTVALCATLKRMAQQPLDTFNVQIQHPRVPLSWFDAVVAPRHDFASAYTHPTLHLTTGTVHAINSELLARETALWRNELTMRVDAQHTSVAWLVGGPCRGFAFTSDDARAMATQFVAAVHNCSSTHQPPPAVLVTFSRRTPAQVRAIIERELRANLDEGRQLFVWDDEGRNPFVAFLARATVVVTTPDSISMTTEAIASGTPVLTISADRAQGKFRRFHDALNASQLAAPFSIESFSAAIALAECTTSRCGNDDGSSDSSAGRHEQQVTPSETLERELDAIANKIADQIHARARR